MEIAECNRMMGTFMVDSLKPGVLHFGPIAGTRMACPDMTTEQSVLGALEKVNSFEVISCDKKRMLLVRWPSVIKMEIKLL